MSSGKQQLNVFISLLAQRINALYPNNCADEEDYIQAGHLKLAEINGSKYGKRDPKAYDIISVSRAMRKVALEAMCVVSAPNRIKRLVHQIEILTALGETEQDICQELKVDTKTLADLRSLSNAESWHRLFDEPTHDSEPFSFIDDLLSSCNITEKERIFIRAQFCGEINNLGLTHKQKWSRNVSLRSKLIRSDYGVC